MIIRMQKPDSVFTVYICPITRLTPCAEYWDQRKRGLIGFHATGTCPHCRRVNDGWEFWGENYHCQGEAKTRASMLAWIKLMARKQWKMRDGRLMGYRFRIGSPICYLANE